MDLVSFIAEPTDDGIIEDLSKTNSREGEKLMLALLEHAVEDFQKKNCFRKPKSGFHCKQLIAIFVRAYL